MNKLQGIGKHNGLIAMIGFRRLTMPTRFRDVMEVLVLLLLIEADSE
ncbi:MAG TPA: hypothetical protein VK666_07905 [Chryseolinea sp.]|nr:hypothetical protein [Chryseolinea sp.]